MNVEIIGFLAGVVTTSSMFPQIIKSIRTRSTKDISVSWCVIGLTGQLLWFVYGVGIGSLSLSVMSGITFFANIFMLFLKLKFG